MDQRQLPEDFKDFIRFLNANDVCYLLVGGWAVGIYGNPRATKDIDFLIAIDDDNLKRLKKALYEFGAPTIDMAHFKEIGNVFRMGRSPVQVDIINEATGVDIKECFARRSIVKVDGVEVSVISKQDLIKNKKASGRNRDLADVESLEETQEDQ
jgi:predicted nucleotidyltransferase